ncbi:hypothetical protein [Xanthomonas sacchari]|uniref:hypothetical protein n=1 Tax=Xanthomonas sacchari TaxID=56458 RepID=UPI002259DE5A|nr:hypothetical protein [Xanthomonas sacchari]MCW0463926.1 hypothetical protein [Xanthomonas sacchari]
MRRVFAGLSVLLLTVGAFMLWQRPPAATRSQPGTVASAAAAEGEARAPGAKARSGTDLPGAEETSPDTTEAFPAPQDRPPAAAAEMAFLTGKSIDGDTAMHVIGDKDFDLILQKVASQAESDGMAKSRTYRRNFSDYLREADPGFALKDVACGTHVCMASASNAHLSDAQFSTAIQAMAGAVDTPMYSIVMQTLPDPAMPGAYLYRLIFTTDPSMASISMQSQ